MSTADKPGPSRERNAFLLAHEPLVKRIAMRLRARLPANVDLQELMQAGLIGLNEAFSRYDEKRGATFDTYAARRIEGAMLDALRAADTLSRGVRRQLREVQAAVQRLEHRLGRVPRAKEVANELGWTLQAFHDCMVAAGSDGRRAGDAALENLADESSAPDDPGDEHAEIDRHADPQRGLEQRQRHAALNAAFDALEERERFVIESILNRNDSLGDIAKTLGVNASRVSQIKGEIVAKLRRRLQDW